MSELEPTKVGYKQKVTANVVRKRSFENPFRFKGHFSLQHWRDGVLLEEILIIPNGVTDIGINSVLDTSFNDAVAKISDWVIGMVDAAGFTAFAPGDTMASHGGWVEFTDYAEGTRPEWDPGSAAAKAITNAVLRDFNITGTASLKGIFISSDATML